jgi:hypothetical protein
VQHALEKLALDQSTYQSHYYRMYKNVCVVERKNTVYKSSRCTSLDLNYLHPGNHVSCGLLHVQYAFLKLSRFTLLVDVVFSNTKIRFTHHLYCHNTFVPKNIYLRIIDEQRQSTFRVPCYLYLVPCEFHTACTMGHIH